MSRTIALVSVCVAAAWWAASAHAINRSWDGGGEPVNNWSNPSNWSPDGVPLFDDDVFIGNLAAAENDYTRFDLPGAEIGSLAVTNGANVDTNGNELIVDGATTLSGLGTTLIVRPNSAGPTLESFDTNTLTIDNDARVSLGGVLSVDEGLLGIYTGGSISGYGLIDLQANTPGTTVFENAGSIVVQRAVMDATLTIQASGGGIVSLGSPGALVDVDDAGAGVFDRANTLIVDGPMADFLGTMDIGRNDTVNIVQNWRSIAEINFNGSNRQATLTGGKLTGILTNIHVNSGRAVIENDLALNSGSVTVNAGTVIQFDGAAAIAGDATFALADNAHEIIVNGSLSIGSAATPMPFFNWDGSNGSVTTTINPGAAMTINATHLDLGGAITEDQFDKAIVLNGGELTVDVGDDAWEMNGLLNMTHVAGQIPILSGDALAIGDDIAGTQDGDILISGAGSSHIDTAVTFFSDAHVHVRAGATLKLIRPVVFNSVNGPERASFTGPGLLYFEGNTTFNEATTIDMPFGRVDLDGLGLAGQTVTLAGSDADLVLNVAGIDSADNSFGNNNIFGTDTIVLNQFSDLVVNLTNPADEWTLNAGAALDINAVGGTLGGSGIAGSDFHMAGTANISGNSIWTARTDISGTVNVAAGGSLNVRGGDLTDANVNRLEGGTITGDGVLRALVDEGLLGFGAINSDVQFANNTELRADDGTLTVDGPILDVGVLGTADSDGVLNVTNPWNTSVAGFVELKGGELTGATITNDNPHFDGGIRGHGLISARVQNGTIIIAGGGRLVINNPANNNDWDGAGNSGALRALGGDLELVDDASFSFRGIADAVQAEVFANGFALQFQPGSQLAFDNGTYRSTHATNIGGNVFVRLSGGVISIPDTVVFQGTSDATLHSDLHLDNTNTVIQVGATFAGGGELVNLAERALTLLDGSNVGVQVTNHGHLEVQGAGTGRVDVRDFLQSATGVFHVDLAGTTLGQFDRLIVDGAAELAGTLDPFLFGGFTPALGDTFTIISATAGVSGLLFIEQPAAMPSGLFFNARYNPSSVQLVVVDALPGDYNRDGVVEAADYTVWRDTLGAVVALGTGADGDGDGMIDTDDYDVWKLNFGEMAAGRGSTLAARSGNDAVPEPQALLPLVLACLAAAGWRCLTPATARFRPSATVPSAPS